MLAGPGWFERDPDDPRRMRAYGSRHDFYIGPDDLGQDPDATWVPRLDVTPAEAEEDIAARIITALPHPLRTGIAPASTRA